MMEVNMKKTELVLGQKYRVVKDYYVVVGILNEIELYGPSRVNGITGDTYGCLELIKGHDRWGDPYTARIEGPWDLIEPVTD